MEVEAPSRGAEMPLSVRRHTRGTSPVPTVRLVLGSTLSPWKIAVLNRAEARKFAELLDKAAAEIKR